MEAAVILDRNKNIDLIKIISMVFVMGLHSRIDIFCQYPQYNMAFYFIHTICGLAIPLFFMVSGYLLLGRDNVTWGYSKKKILGIIRFVLIITVSYWLLKSFVSHTIDLKSLWDISLGSFFQRGEFSQFWYFGAMIIIYLLYPAINRIYPYSHVSHGRMDVRICTYIYLVACISIFCTFIFIANLLEWNDGLSEKIIPQCLRIWSWAMYFCLGGLAKRFKLSKNSVYFMALFACVYVLIKSISLQFMGRVSPEYYFASPITVIYVYLVFNMFLNIHITCSKAINRLSQLFLPVYALHMLIIGHTRLVAEYCVPLGVVAPFVYWTFISIMTILLSHFIMKIPLADKLFRI